MPPRSSAVRSSCFANGSYHGYEVRLRVERVGNGYEPYQVRNSRDIYDFMQPLADESSEFMYSLNFDGKNRVTGVYLVGKGSCTCCMVDPKEVFKSVLVANSPAFALAHNHPSGIVEPSQEDLSMMTRVSDGARLLGLTFLDFLIVGYESYLSALDQGLLRR
ncbi:MAG: JAB domain-containing protein [Acidobacteria bacterium]|nr:JAB domain-containing protein [Acidobacteriota bacterium]